MTAMVNNLAKENERQNARLATLEDLKKSQDEKIKALELKNKNSEHQETNRFWKLQLEKLQSSMNTTLNRNLSEKINP